MIRVIEAFAGVGSQRMALRNLGIKHEVVGLFEIDKYALKSYEAIHGDCPNLGDISKIDVSDVPDHDLFTYSFPCQDISTAGKQAGLSKDSGTRSSLLWECDRIIKHKRPKYLLMENVKNLVGKKHIDSFKEWLSLLESYGYKNYWKVLNAKDYGIPQNRERVFCISILDGEFEFKNTTSNYDICDFLGIDNFECFIDDTKGYDGVRVFKNYSPCLCASRSGIKVKYNNVERKMTPNEYWTLFGFSQEDYNKASLVCSKTQLYKQAGNSIVVNVLEEIFKEMFKNEQ